MTQTQTSEQRRADCAFELVKDVESKSWKKDYGRFAHKLPILIRTCGPVAALEFLRTRKKENDGRPRGNEDGPGETLLQHLATQFAKANLLAPDKATRDGLLEKVRKAPLPEYIRLTRELLAVLNWHKRLSVSVLDVHAGDGD